ncbi:hypothetical protein [Kitasatospora sp. NPDC091207]|uniref:hypothetical protein n=1 Tax=Kitasatospora sp. NPDC091207 TaxID=3364083 RepID=UPI0037F8769A
MTRRVQRADLPAFVREAVEAGLRGPVRLMRSLSGEFDSEIAAKLVAPTGSVFLKARHIEHPDAWALWREAEVNPYVTRVAPRLLWQVEVDGWRLLGFEHVDGRPPA